MGLNKLLVIAAALLCISASMLLLHPASIVSRQQWNRTNMFPELVQEKTLQVPVSTIAPKITQTIRVPILMYHYVEVPIDPKDTIRRSLDILPGTFDAQVSTLITNGYTPIFMSELADYFDGNRVALPDKPIVLTFDDGYGDFYTDVYPTLLKYHVKATAYIISGVLGKHNYMTAAQIQDIAASGFVEVAAHTVHHPSLKGLQQQLLKVEVDQSKRDLEKLIGKPVTDFAYPYGAYNNAVIVEVAAAGFQTAVTTKPGVYQTKDGRYILPRLRPGGRVGKSLLEWLNTVK